MIYEILKKTNQLNVKGERQLLICFVSKSLMPVVKIIIA